MMKTKNIIYIYYLFLLVPLFLLFFIGLYLWPNRYIDLSYFFMSWSLFAALASPLKEEWLSDRKKRFSFYKAMTILSLKIEQLFLYKMALKRIISYMSVVIFINIMIFAITGIRGSSAGFVGLLAACVFYFLFYLSTKERHEC